MSAFNRLIDRLHRVFNKSPQSVAVIQIGGNTNWTIRIAALKMTVASDNTPAVEINLASGTVQDVADDLVAQGFNATVLGQGGLLARGLLASGEVRTEGDVAATTLTGSELTDLSGDTLTLLSTKAVLVHYPTSPLWTELSTYGWELDDQTERLKNAEGQLYLDTAEDKWLELWGNKYLGTPRVAGESDAAYATRIVQELLRPNQNNVALELILRDAMGVNATIIDAWPNKDDLPVEQQSGARGRFLLDLAIDNNLTTQEANALIENCKAVIRRHKAAGTDFLETVLRKMVQLTETVATSEAFTATITAAFNETYLPGGVRCGAAWRCGCPGLVSGTNDAIKEQIRVMVLNAGDNSLASQTLYGG